MPGTGRQKGMRYGLSLGLMIFVAMFEGVGMLGTPLIGEMIMGLADAVPIALMIAILGWTLTKGSPDAPVHLPVWPVLIAFALVYGLGRTAAQMLALIGSGLTERPLSNLIWPFAMGAAIGVLFLALGDALRRLSRVAGVLAFGIGVFGGAGAAPGGPGDRARVPCGWSEADRAKPKRRVLGHP